MQERINGWSALWLTINLNSLSLKSFTMFEEVWLAVARMLDHGWDWTKEQRSHFEVSMILHKQFIINIIN